MRENAKSAAKKVASARKRVIDAQQRIEHREISQPSEDDYHQKVAVKAYELFERRGCEHGFDLDDWFEAERLIQENAKR